MGAEPGTRQRDPAWAGSQRGGTRTQQILYESHFGGTAANYERYFVPAIGAKFAHDLIELAQLRPGEDVLDLACGTGIAAKLAAERVGESAVVGVDINLSMLSVARDTAPAIEWWQASAEALPFGAATFDVVLCQMGIQFISDRQRALGEMRRVLKPGGRVVLSVPGPTPPLFRVFGQALHCHIGPEAGGFVATVFSLHDAEEVGRLVEAAGFTNVRARSAPVNLTLPAAAEDFFWQYVYSTPLADAARKLDEVARAELQEEVVTGCAQLTENGALVLNVDVTTASGCSNSPAPDGA